ncbi:hypothetical protein ZWY2020_023045 [Hordeum vulgare]|nr:hypothetical protein ZWY2020_023045 [Hordeum vulgare]
MPPSIYVIAADLAGKERRLPTRSRFEEKTAAAATPQELCPHGFVHWHDGPTSAFLRVLLGDLRDRVWMLENEAAAMCKDEDAGVGVCVEEQKRNEQTSSTGYSLARKGLMPVCAVVIFVSGLVLGMLLS